MIILDVIWSFVTRHQITVLDLTKHLYSFKSSFKYVTSWMCKSGSVI